MSLGEGVSGRVEVAKREASREVGELDSQRECSAVLGTACHCLFVCHLK